MVIDLLYSQIVSDVHNGSVRISPQDIASVKAMLGNIIIIVRVILDETTDRTHAIVNKR